MLIIGIFFLIFPLFLTLLFKNRPAGFLLVLSSMLFFSGLTSLLLSYFHIFNRYSVSVFVILATVISVAILILRLTKNDLSFSKPSMETIFVILAFCIIAVELYSVHFNYTGIVSTVQGNMFAESTKYPYPMYSDEYVAVSYVNEINKTGLFPSYNIFFPKNVFYNFAPLFFSLLAYICTWLNISPLLYYAWFQIIFGLMFCLVAYLTLRVFKVNVFGSVVATLFLPFVINAANLPGIWFLIPYNLGLIILVASFGLREYFGSLVGIISSLVAFLFYPPLIIFLLPVLFIAFYDNRFLFRRWLNARYRLLGLLSLIAVLIALIISAFGVNNIVHFFSAGFTHVLRDANPSYKENFLPWTVIPIYIFPIILLSVISSIFGLQKKYKLFLWVIVTGLIFWMINYLFEYQIIIGHPRLASITSYLIVVFSGIGFGKIYEKYIENRHVLHLRYGREIVFVFTIICFLVPAFYYTKIETWKNTYIVNYKKVAEVLKISEEQAKKTNITFPSPINRYLWTEDLMIFKNIKNKVFVSHIWKSLVLASATGNFPLQTKKSFMGVNILETEAFIKASCEQKVAYANKYKIDYIYLQPFKCNQFVEIDSSQENFVLYKFEKK